MGDIKMSDMLMLPVKRVNGGVMPFLKDDNDEVMFVGTRYHVDLCVTAINAYDANQERITELESMVDILQRAARQTDNQFRIHAKLDSDTKTILSCALNKTEQQCLADVRADAVDEFIKLVTSKHGNALTQPRLRACAKQLRKRGEKCL